MRVIYFECYCIIYVPVSYDHRSIKTTSASFGLPGSVIDPQLWLSLQNHKGGFQNTKRGIQVQNVVKISASARSISCTYEVVLSLRNVPLHFLFIQYWNYMVMC